MSKNVTIVDIAKEAGVSISTVSRVLTGNARVNKEKEIEVKRVIKKYNFKPNILARGLINSHSNLIGILTADIRNPFYSTLFVNCEQSALEAGYSLMLCNSFSDRLNEFTLIDKLVQQKVDAIILIGGACDELKTDSEFAQKITRISQSIPVVTVGHLSGTNCTSILINMEKVMNLVMDFLTKNSRIKKIAFAGGSSTVASTNTMRTVFKKLLKKHHLEYFPEFDIQNERYDEDGGYESMNEILKKDSHPDAVIAVNDISAAGIIRSIHEHNLRIPQDISVISFGNTYLSSLLNPSLTTVGCNFRTFGGEIIKTALSLIKKEPVQKEILIEPSLTIRNSCIGQ